MASKSLCPPERNTTPGVSFEIEDLRHFNVFSATSSTEALLLLFDPETIIFGFKRIPLILILFLSKASYNLISVFFVTSKQRSIE